MESAEAAIARRWIVRPQLRPSARLRLFCFPYAGGGAAIYRPWVAFLPDDIELCAIQAPGREERIAEAPLTNFADVVAKASEAMQPLLDRPYAVFGHSLGASVAFETLRALEASGAQPPELFIPSGRRAPSVAPTNAPIADLPEAAFLAGIARSSGPDPAFTAFVQHAELVELLLPLLRADFSLAERYAPLGRNRLRCPVVAFSSADDAQAREAAIAPWAEVTSGSFAHRIFPGAHLYINAHRAEVVAALIGLLAAR